MKEAVREGEYTVRRVLARLLEAYEYSPRQLEQGEFIMWITESDAAGIATWLTTCPHEDK
jgi:hypothetical protein